MAKDDLIKEAEELGIELTGKETVPELEELIAKSKGELDEVIEKGKAELEELAAKGAGGLSENEGDGEGALVRHKINRGSRRRIERALAKVQEDFDAAIKEFDQQAYIADEKGNRAEPWPLVKALRHMREEVTQEVNRLLAE